MNKYIVITATLTALAMPLAVNAQTTFGSVPGTSIPYGGTGIPSGASEVTQITATGGNTITLALSATAYKENPTPGNNGAGTYTVGTGLVNSRSTWNFDFYVANSGSSVTSGGVTYELVIDNLGNGEVTSFDPLNSLLGDTTTASSAGNSESLDFAAFGGPIGYNASLNDTYDFDLEAFQGGVEIGSDSITVVAGTGAVPEPTTVMAGALMLLPLGIGGYRALRRKQANA